MGDRQVLGIIGGSGVYSVDALDDAKTIELKTPWGDPSGPLMTGRMNGIDVVFLARHGAGHRLTPGDINFRANIDALKQLGVTDVLSLSACGSFREDLPPGMFVIVDQFIDRTTNRHKTFFGEGFVAHVSMADPVCSRLGDVLEAGCRAQDIRFHRGGTYLAIDGPQFSSRAESHLYRSWGCDVIGMTNMPEAKLAREAELPYATTAMVTDFDCWRETEGPVDVASVIAVMQQNTLNAARLIDHVTSGLTGERDPSPSGAETMLDISVITPPDAQSPSMKEALSTICARYFRANG